MEFVITIIPIISILTLAFVIHKRSISKAKRYFLFLSLIIVFWAFFNLVALLKLESEYSLFFVRMVMFFAVWMLFTFGLFIYSLVKESLPNKKILISSLVISAALSLLVFSSLFFSSLDIQSGKVIIEHEWATVVFGIWSVIVLTASFVWLKEGVRQNNGVKKSQVLYVGFGILATIMCLFIFNFILVVIYNNSFFVTFGPLYLMPFIISSSYALIKFRLFDIKIVIRKSAIQIATFVILFALYAYLLLLAQRSSSNAVSLSDETTLLLAILIIAATIEPLRRLIYKWIDNLFESKERDREEALKRVRLLSASNVQYENLKSTTTLELSKALESEVQFYLNNGNEVEIESLQIPETVYAKIKEGHILIKDELSYQQEVGTRQNAAAVDFMRQNNISAILPIGEQDQLIGIFVVQSKEKGAPLTLEKVEFMKSFSRQIEFAFASSLAYKYAIERIKI